MSYARTAQRLNTLLVTLFVILIAAVTARGAPLTDTEKAIIAVLLGNKSSFYSVGGTVTYLASGKTLTLQLNGGNNLSISSNGGFTFSEDVMGGDNYQVTVLSQPTGQTCTVTNGAGSVEDDVKNVSVTCDSGSTYAAIIRGRTIDGYIQGATVFLDINGNSTLDGDEPSGTSGEGGRFEIGLNEEQAACKALAPVVADVPVGAIDETEGEVTEAYQMALPPGTDAIQSGNEVNITPLTSILWAELFALYSNGALPGISCAELENNSDAQEELRRKIDETIANAVRAYNVPEADLLSDYMASGATNAQRTAEDIVTGLKWSLREKLRLEQLYLSNEGVRVVVKKVTAESVNDSSLASSEYGWYREWFVNDGGLLRSGVARMSEDLSSELYIVFYKEVYPWTPNAGGVEYQYAREMARTTEFPGYDYVCVGFERLLAVISYEDGKGRLEYGVENSTSTEVNGFEECNENIHRRALISQNLTVTEYSFGRADNIYKEQGYYSFPGDQAPLPETQGVALAPDEISGGLLKEELNQLDWRFPESYSAQAQFTSKHLETDGQQVVTEKFTDPEGQWRRLERFENGTSLEQWAFAPFETPAECIDWQDTFDNSGPPNVIANCDSLTSHIVTPTIQGSGAIFPTEAITVINGSRARINVQADDGAKLLSVGGSCGGQLAGSTYVTDPILSNCSVEAVFETIDDGVTAVCPNEAWVQRGQTLVGGTGDESELGSVVAMSGDGLRIAVSHHNLNAPGIVKTYEWNGTQWNLYGFPNNTRFFGSGERFWNEGGTQSMGDLALNSDGSVLVIGTPISPNHSCTSDLGCELSYTRVYTLLYAEDIGYYWGFKGNPIYSYTEGSDEGSEVEISADGDRLFTFSRGDKRWKVFDWNGSDWVEVYQFKGTRHLSVNNSGDAFVVYYREPWGTPENNGVKGKVHGRSLINGQWKYAGYLEGNEDTPWKEISYVALSHSSGALAVTGLDGVYVVNKLGLGGGQVKGEPIKGPGEVDLRLFDLQLAYRNGQDILIGQHMSVGAWAWISDTLSQTGTGFWRQIGTWFGTEERGIRSLDASADGSVIVTGAYGRDDPQGQVKVYALSCPE